MAKQPVAVCFYPQYDPRTGALLRVTGRIQYDDGSREWGTVDPDDYERALKYANAHPQRRQ
jgi:hypothetical protein